MGKAVASAERMGTEPWRLDLYDFDLPTARIADRPIRPRDAARLLVVAENLQDRMVRDLPSLLRPGDVMVFNDTRVIPARLEGRRGEARIEITLHKRESGDTWRAFARPAKKLRTGDCVDFSEGFAATVAAKGEGGEVLLRFDRAGAALRDALFRHGAMPLPPYLKRPADEADLGDYQTIYARDEGAVAAPTAGLHFTERLLAALDEKKIRRVTVTLHVGAGTFLPVKSEDIRDHRMHAEWGRITRPAAEAINEARERGGRVVAVGTTSLRILESAATDSGHLRAFDGETDIFIYPGYRFRLVDILMTNFHLPRSTLFMLVAAFAGLARMHNAYRHAIEHGYRFYSYGDACLLHRAENA